MNRAAPLNVFEQDAIRRVTGDTIRPGGLALTDHALARCGLPERARVLDVGCGAAATVEHLARHWHFDAVGLDPSAPLLESGHARHADLRLLRARGEDLPFPRGAFDAVLAECVLSLMPDLGRALAAFSRVLRGGGMLVVSDMCARAPDGFPAVSPLPMATCLGSALSSAALAPVLAAHGLDLVLWEDHTRALKELAARIIFEHGSLAQFWHCTAGDTGTGEAMRQAAVGITPGYFLLLARKEKKST